MTKHTPNLTKIWRAAKQDTAFAFDCHRTALMFLGAVLTRTITGEIHEHFRTIPGIWLYGPQCSGKSVLAGVASSFLHAEGESSAKVYTRNTPYKSLFMTLFASGPWSNPIIEEYVDEKRETAKRALLQSIMGGESVESPSGSIVKLPVPLAVVGVDTTEDPALSSRFLHFRPSGALKHHKIRCFADQEEYWRIGDHLLNQSSDWPKMVVALALESECKIGLAPELTGRESLMQRIAWATAVVAEHYLDPEAKPRKSLRHWLNANPQAFRNPLALV